MPATKKGHTIVSVSPHKCRMWNLHDRDPELVTEKTCRSEIASFSRLGQLVLVLGRPLRNDPMFEVELIYGARRLFVARHLNIPLRVELRELSDRDAIVAMDVENRHRQDISPYERGSSYARWLREGYFASQDDIAAALKISASQVSRLIKIGRLPPVIINAFEHPADICESWGLELASAIEDAQRRPLTVRAAREIALEPNRPAAPEVRRRLLSAGIRPRRPAANQSEVVVADDGTPLYRMRLDGSWITLRIPRRRLSTTTLQDLRSDLRALLLNLPAESPQARTAAPPAPVPA
jgi:ParB family chromosome partitioning protein